MDSSVDDEEGEETDSLRIQCKYNGLPNYGRRGQLLMRLKRLKEFREENAAREEGSQRGRRATLRLGLQRLFRAAGPAAVVFFVALFFASIRIVGIGGSVVLRIQEFSLEFLFRNPLYDRWRII